MITDLNEYNKKIREDLTITTEQYGMPFQFKTTWGLFSPKNIDDGSQMLLNYLDIETNFDCLDMGSGYGVLGVCMAKKANQGKTILVDKDFVAVDYSNKNIKLNHIDNADCFLSNGFDALNEQKFDLIVSNIPAKVGKEMLYMYMFDAKKHLKPGGAFYIVTITGLRQFFKRGFQEVFGNYKKIKQGKVYTVAKAIKE